ncbi:hypothetical protein FRC12_004874 [Ceratobasidium sp. 428]|nr:hypothetical protein FRC12_004874 [Ceratobasidium sp. 428]
MNAYREKLRARSDSAGPRASPAAKQQRATAKYLDLAGNPDATPDDLRAALLDAVSMIKGSEARAALLGSELASTKEAIRGHCKQSGRGRRVGQARVYTQAEIQAEERRREEYGKRDRTKPPYRCIYPGM